MRDKCILVTGGSDGMGKATAKQLAKQGARLLLVSRNQEKGNAAVREIIDASGNESVTFLQADLSLVHEMRRAAQSIGQSFDRLDGLVHGAGGVFPPQRTITAEGLELVFAVQYLARYLITNQLLDLLHAAPSPQVMSIAGGGRSKGFDFDNLQGEKSYSILGAVERAGATCDLLTKEHIDRYRDIVFYNYGPGIVRTMATMPNRLMWLLVNTVLRPFSRTAEQAANDIVALLTSEHRGGFYGPALKQNEFNVVKSDAAKLWDHSKQLIDNLSA
jgi:hypothetical protein